MDDNIWLMIAIFILGTGSLIGFFKTKTEGFGRFTTSTLLIMLVVIISALLYSSGKLESQVMANILFAVFGLQVAYLQAKMATKRITRQINTDNFLRCAPKISGYLRRYMY